MFLITSMILPFFPIKANAASVTIPPLKIGVESTGVGSWDGIIATSGFHADYGANALEGLVGYSAGWTGDPYDLTPVLASSWTIHEWPEEPNQLGWINKGGIRAITLILRDDVTFHDGSAWNATVAKWNIDRNMVMTGNITGSITVYDIGVTKARTAYWVNAEDWVEYETDTWNVSQFVGQPGEYEGFGTSPDDYMIGRYSRIKNVTILEEGDPYGGTIKIYYNDWGGAGSQLLYGLDFLFISMDAYKDYSDRPIYGLGQVAEFPQPPYLTGDPDDYPTTGFRGHMIGTGPYIFIQQNELIFQGGRMVRNPNWWNVTNAAREGLHQVEELAFAYFYPDDLTGRTIGMVTGGIDIADDSIWGGNLIYDEIIADDDLRYKELGLEPTRTFITLNCINETYWKYWADNPSRTPSEIKSRTELHDIDGDGTIHVDGIDRALRKALSYAFDYDTFINVSMQGRAVRSGGFLGVEHEFYNPNISLPYRDINIARQTLIDDPKWGPIVANRSLTINNATADWISVANGPNPIFKFKLMWEVSTTAQADLFSTNIKEIGIRLDTPDGKRDNDLKLVQNIYQVMIFRLDEFPAFTYHGVPTNWPDSNYNNVPVIEYYYKSPGLPYVNGSGLAWPGVGYLGGQFFNIAFHYNETVDKWIEKMWFADRDTTRELMNNMTKHTQTWHYTEIMISQNSYGIAMDKDWDYFDIMGTWAFAKYLPASGGNGGVQIPGFQTAPLLAIAIITITGIGYSLNRKRKRAEK
jgi:ABC-type transport system substrate-binding protein